LPVRRITVASYKQLTTGNGLFIAGGAFTHALASAAAGDLRFEAAALAGFQIEGVLFGIGDDAFASDGTLKATDGALNTLVIVNLYSCHSIPPKTHNNFVMSPAGGFNKARLASLG
jgi:hypothetical protein